MLRKTLLFLSEHENLKETLLGLPAGRRMAARFVAGETIADALSTARALDESGFRVTLDYLGESVHEPNEAERATAAYKESLERIAASDVRSTISLKLTQLGLELDETACGERLERIVARAAELGNFVRIDMEDSGHTEATLRLFRGVFSRHRNVGVVIQAYLRRSADDVADLIRIGAPVRLCKGAYNESAPVAYQKGGEIDASFVRLMKALLGPGPSVDGAMPVPRVALATHDDRLIEEGRRYALERGIPRDAFE
ncbi:MAG: proline dehydrogenase family protein, partial [Gemmatimonadota bacterium]